MFEQIITIISVIFTMLGFGGLIIVVTGNAYKDTMLNYAYTFVYSYMLVLGILLYVYRNRILVK